jgi:hypothetical protein
VKESKRPKTEPDFESEHGDTFIGPAPAYSAFLLLTNNWIWLGAVIAGLPFAALYFPQLSAFQPYAPVFFGVGFLFCMFGITWAKLLYRHTKYIVRDNVLFVYTGVFNRTVNTIPLRFIFDCDLTSNLAEMAWSVEKIHLKVLEGTRNRVDVTLHFISDAESKRDYLLSESATRQSTLITAV